MKSDTLLALNELLRSPRAVGERTRSGGDLRPLFAAALGALLLGAGIFGATLATSRAACSSCTPG